MLLLHGDVWIIVGIINAQELEHRQYTASRLYVAAAFTRPIGKALGH